MLGLGIVVALLLAAICAPLLAPTDPLLQDLGGWLLPPLSPGYILGSDELGRDILSRLLYGARITLYIVALVVVTAPGRRCTRSEEHTSELQSLMRISYAVFCLKKQKQQTHKNNKREPMHHDASRYTKTKHKLQQEQN